MARGLEHRGIYVPGADERRFEMNRLVARVLPFDTRAKAALR
jgi:hypothetical protein